MKANRAKLQMLKLLLVVSIILSQVNVVALVAYANVVDNEGDNEITLNAQEEIDATIDFGGDHILDVDNVEPDGVRIVENVDPGVQVVDGLETDDDFDLTDEIETTPEEDLNEAEEESVNEEDYDREEDLQRSSSARSIASGVVQFELVPVVSSLPAGVTEAQARTALMNVTSV